MSAACLLRDVPGTGNTFLFTAFMADLAIRFICLDTLFSEDNNSYSRLCTNWIIWWKKRDLIKKTSRKIQVRGVHNGGSIWYKHNFTKLQHSFMNFSTFFRYKIRDVRVERRVNFLCFFYVFMCTFCTNCAEIHSRTEGGIVKRT